MKKTNKLGYNWNWLETVGDGEIKKLKVENGIQIRFIVFYLFFFSFLKMGKLNEVLRSFKRRKETCRLDYMVLWGASTVCE